MHTLTALQLGREIASRRIGAVEAARAALDRIDQAGGSLNAFITVTRKEAIAQADDIQRKIDAGERLSPLAGVPMALKDNLSTLGIRTTCASRMLDTYLPAFDAAVVEKLRAGGAVLLGKLNMDEFAMGSTNETSYYGPVLNPWDETRTPGGSSGGAAAAVAAGLAHYALGSDTGGSIRQPCGFCGVTGLKPTYGAVSRYGLIAYASSLDQVGPIARTAADCAAVFCMIAGLDTRDGTSHGADVYWHHEEDHAPSQNETMACHPSSLQSLRMGLELDVAYTARGIRIGLPEEAFAEGLDAEVKAAVLSTVRDLEAQGAQIIPLSMPMLKYAIPAYYIIASAEASSNLSRYDGLRYGLPAEGASLHEAVIHARSMGFGREVKRRIMLGNFVLSAGYFDAYYQKALKAKALLCQSFQDAFRRVDMLLSPVSPMPAMRLGESLDHPLAMYLSDIHTVAVNLAGLPALALPCGMTKTGLPMGMQLIGPAFHDAALLRVGMAYQAMTDHHLMQPDLPGKRHNGANAQSKTDKAGRGEANGNL